MTILYPHVMPSVIPDIGNHIFTTSLEPFETTMLRLENFIDSKTTKDAKKYTDENASYGRLSNHESVRHSVGEYVRGLAHVNGMESFWSIGPQGLLRRISPHI